MAGQAAFDFVFKEMIPEGAKKDAKPSTSCPEEESDGSAKKISLKWRPSVSDLLSEDEKDPCVDGQPSCSWGSLGKPSSKTSLSFQVEDEKFQVQLALEDGKLALEDEVKPKTMEHDDGTSVPSGSKQRACKKKPATAASPKKKSKGEEPACKKKPATAASPKKKSKGEECTKKVKASPCTKKSHKVLADDRKTFANRTCPPGPEGSTRFKAIKTAYNEVIKHKISRNQEVGFCLLALPVKVCHSQHHIDFVLKPITGRLCSGPFVARHGRGRSWPCMSTRRSL